MTNRKGGGMNKPLLWYPSHKFVGDKLDTKGKYLMGYPLGAIVHFTSGEYGLSSLGYAKLKGYTFLMIDKDGTVYQSFPLDEWGYHAGKSYWKGLGSGVSKHLVGIEVCCGGNMEKKGGKFKTWWNKEIPENEIRYSEDNQNIQAGHYQKFTEAQERALIKLILWLKENNPMVFNLEYVLGHDQVSPDRKCDPGASLSMTMPVFQKKLKELYTKDKVPSIQLLESSKKVFT